MRRCCDDACRRARARWPELQCRVTRIRRGCCLKKLMSAFRNRNARTGSLPFSCFPVLSLGQKSCRTKVPQIFQFFLPDFAPNFAPNFPEFFKDFSCFVSCETETRKNSPKIPAIFQCKIPRQIRKRYSQKFSGEQAK